MANTLIQQAALDFVFSGATDNLDYDGVTTALKDFVQPLDAVSDDVFIWQPFETFDAPDLLELLENFVSSLTKFAGDVLASA